jgi:hypothetical protein
MPSRIRAKEEVNQPLYKTQNAPLCLVLAARFCFSTLLCLQYER